jgi:hypothetical protein
MKLNISDEYCSACTRLIIPKKRIEESNRGDRGKPKRFFYVSRGSGKFASPHIRTL